MYKQKLVTNPHAVQQWKARLLIDGLRRAILGQSDVEVFAFHNTVLECSKEAFEGEQAKILKELKQSE